MLCSTFSPQFFTKLFLVNYSVLNVKDTDTPDTLLTGVFLSSIMLTENFRTLTINTSPIVQILTCSDTDMLASESLDDVIFETESITELVTESEVDDPFFLLEPTIEILNNCP